MHFHLRRLPVRRSGRRTFSAGGNNYGEAETGPLATSWHSNKFLNPVHHGAVLPILHLNGYKIDGPTVLGRISHDELDQLSRGYGYKPYFVEGDEPDKLHQIMAAALDTVVAGIKDIQTEARNKGFKASLKWPMIILHGEPFLMTCGAATNGHRALEKIKSIIFSTSCNCIIVLNLWNMLAKENC